MDSGLFDKGIETVRRVNTREVEEVSKESSKHLIY